MNQLKTYLIFLILFLAFSSFGQSNRKKIKSRFAASALVGANFSQVDGDNSSGFDKAGWYGGVRSTIILNHRLQWNIELLFCQKGSRLERKGSIFLQNEKEKIIVDYVEVPLLLKIYTIKDLEGFYLEAGFSYSRQVRVKIQEEIFDPSDQFAYSQIAPEFKKSEFSMIGGLGIDFKKHYSLGARISYALTPLYQNQNFQAPEILTHRVEPVFRLRNYFISLMTSYRF